LHTGTPPTLIAVAASFSPCGDIQSSELAQNSFARFHPISHTPSATSNIVEGSGTALAASTVTLPLPLSAVSESPLESPQAKEIRLVEKYRIAKSRALEANDSGIEVHIQIAR